MGTRARRLAPLAIAAATLVASWAALLVLIGRDGTHGLRSERDDAVSAASSDAGGVEILDPGPLGSSDVALVATDREVVVLGTGDGAAYDPELATWRSVAAPPLPAGSEPAVGAWTGSDLVMFRADGAAAWNPDADAWRRLPDPPAGPVRAAEWTGREIVVWPGPAALDPVAGTWRTLPPPPVPVEFGNGLVLAWTGDELLLVGRSAPGTQGVVLGGTAAAAYDQSSDTWRELPPPTGLEAQALAGDWNGHELVVVNYDMAAQSYDAATERWRGLPRVPARFGEWIPFVASTGDQTAVLMGQALAVLDESGGWTPLPYGELSPYRAPVPLGGRLYFFGLTFERQRNSFARVDLDALVRRAETLQVGAFTLTLPDGARLARARFERYEAVEGLPPAETVSVRLTGDAGKCRVASTYVGTFGEIALDLTASRERSPVTVTPVDGSERWEGIAGRDPRRGLVRLDDSDLLEITCRKRGQARELARYASPPR